MFSGKTGEIMAAVASGTQGQANGLGMETWFENWLVNTFYARLFLSGLLYNLLDLWLPLSFFQVILYPIFPLFYNIFLPAGHKDSS